MKLTKTEEATLVARVNAKLAADSVRSSSCVACGRPLTSSEMSAKGWISGHFLDLCHRDAVHVNNHLLVDFQEQLGYTD